MPTGPHVIHAKLSYTITGILFTVHNALGRYCNEQQYGDAIEVELKYLSIPYQREFPLPPLFEGEMKGRNKVDFLIENKIILEIKAKTIITQEDYYQLRRYLGAAQLKLGMLVNFRNKYLHPKRVLNSTLPPNHQ